MKKAKRLDACRVCGCTENNACWGGCSWVKVEIRGTMPHFPPVPPLCSECSGTNADLMEALGRIADLSRVGGGFEVVGLAARIARAARTRFAERQRPPALRSIDPTAQERMRRRRARLRKARLQK